MLQFPTLSTSPSCSPGPEAECQLPFITCFSEAGKFSLHLYFFQKKENSNPGGVRCHEKWEHAYFLVELRLFLGVYAASNMWLSLHTTV